MARVKKVLFLISLSLSILGSSYGKNIDVNQASSYATSFLTKINLRFGTQNIMNHGDYKEFKDGSETLAFIYKLKPQGFIIVAAYDQVSPLIGFSIEDDWPEDQSLTDMPAYAIVKQISLDYKNANNPDKTSGNTKDMVDVVYGPYLTTIWGQVNCYNNLGNLINVTNYYTPNNYACGCVSLVLATVLNYYKWPIVGEGYNQYYDGSGSSNGTYEAYFGESHYKWGSIQDQYYGVVSTATQREAAGELAFQAAVALEVNFESTGTSSNVNKIPATGVDYFRFYSYYSQINTPSFWTNVDNNIMEARPVILAISTTSGFGHAIVSDGLWTSDADPFYHLNMGWWGSANGWYTIKGDFNAGGYSNITGAVLDFLPRPWLHDIEIPADTNKFELTWQYSHTLPVDAYEVQQKINNGSWVTLTNSYQDTSMVITMTNPGDAYYFRVRAEVNNTWYSSAWSNEVQVQYSGTQIQSGILLVNDNNYDATRVGVLETSLANLGYNYTLFECDQQGSSPSLSLMQQYGVVIWYTGNDGVGLYLWNGNDSENQNIKDYIDGGGNFWLQGLDFLYDKYGQAPDYFTSGSFAYDYLGISEYAGQSHVDDGLVYNGVPQLDLIPGNGIFTLNPITWTYTTMYFVDALLPASGTSTLYGMGPVGYDLDDYFAGIYREKGNGKVMTYTFETARINSQENTDTLFSQGLKLFESILQSDYFVDVKVFLEGPYNSSEMTTTLSTEGLLPMVQPYNVDPWNYYGEETVDAIPNNDVVDWVLVELRDAQNAESATGSSRVARKAAFLLKDGSVVDTDGYSLLTFSEKITENLFVIVWQENHLGVLSSGSPTFSNNIYFWDFTSSNTTAFGTDAQKYLGEGIYGMYSGDALVDGIINQDDITWSWVNECGLSGYLSGDMNLDSQCNNQDKNNSWSVNYGKQCQIPE